MTGLLLRPDPEALGREWGAIVREEKDQVETVREWHHQDHYTPIAHHFADDPHRKDDALLDYILGLTRPDATWLDIGAGGGRYTLPLALSSQHVIAVEPSAAMLDILQSSMQEHAIQNIAVHELRWPEGADQLRADFSLIAHVGYDIQEINPFIDGLEQATREECVAVMMDRAPSSGYTRLWEKVHGHPRQQLPAMREFLHLLLARGVAPEVKLFPRTMRSLSDDELREEARRRLWLTEGSEKARKLQALLDEEIRSGVDDYQVPTVVAVIHWRPAGCHRATA